MITRYPDACPDTEVCDASCSSEELAALECMVHAYNEGCTPAHLQVRTKYSVATTIKDYFVEPGPASCEVTVFTDDTHRSDGMCEFLTRDRCTNPEIESGSEF